MSVFRRDLHIYYVKAIRQAIKDGKSPVVIADELGLNKSTVYKYIDQYGIKYSRRIRT